MHKKGWMDDGGIQIWQKIVPDFFDLGVSANFFLCTDMLQSHLVDSVTAGIRRENTAIDAIHGGLTSLVQALDVSIHKLF